MLYPFSFLKTSSADNCDSSGVNTPTLMEILLYVWVLNQQQNITRYYLKRRGISLRKGDFNAEAERTPRKTTRKKKHLLFRVLLGLRPSPLKSVFPPRRVG